MSSPSSPPAATPTGPGVDDTKAAAIPSMMIVAIILAIFFTRHSLSSAFTVAKEDFRKMILFGGGLICTFASVFLLPTSAWNFGAASVLFAYMSTLLCTPGLLEAKAETFFAIYLAWFFILIGTPDGWSEGIMYQIDKCDTYFPNTQDKMCKDGWVTFTIILAVAIIIINFFCVIALMSLVFNASDSAYAYNEVPDGPNVASGADVDGEYQAAPESSN